MGDVYVSVSRVDAARIANPTVCAGPDACMSDAEQMFHRALAVTRAGDDEVASEFRWRNAILVARQRLARVAEGRGDLSGARVAYAEIAKAYGEMSAAMPKHSRWKENRMAMHWSIGRINEQLCDPRAAMNDYASALELARELHRIEPGRIDWHRHLSRGLAFAARTAHAFGSLDDARTFDEESRHHNLALSERRPDDQELRKEIEESNARLENRDIRPDPACTSALR